MSARKQQDLAVVENDHQIQEHQPHQSPLVNVLNVLISKPELDVDRIERMIEMQMNVEANEARKAYAADFADMQPKLPVIERKGTSHHGKYGRWEDIVEQITPIIAEHGFSLSFKVKADAEYVQVTCILRHYLGHSEETSFPFPVDKSGNKNPIQQIGSSTSYGKRYTASALLNIVTKNEDQDGNIPDETLTDEQQERLKKMLDEVNGDIEVFLQVAKADSFDKIKQSRLGWLEQKIEEKRKAKKK